MTVCIQHRYLRWLPISNQLKFMHYDDTQFISIHPEAHHCGKSLKMHGVRRGDMLMGADRLNR